MVLPRKSRARTAALTMRLVPGTELLVPYPDPDAEPVPTELQGPNEQSIVASGFTLEEWQLKHPGQVLGPAPEDVGQVTTDPIDGSDPEPDPIWPGTFTSVDPDGMKTRAENEDPTFPGDGTWESPLAITSPTPGSTVPPVHDILGTGAVPTDTVELWHVEGGVNVASTVADVDGNWGFTGDTPASLGAVTWEVRDSLGSASVSITVAEGGGTPQESSPWYDLTTHAQLNAYLAAHGIIGPDDWDNMTLALKRAWLDKHIGGCD